MTLAHDKICLIGLPEGASCVEIDSIKDDKLTYWMETLMQSGLKHPMWYSVDLPPGNWKLIGIESIERPLTESECKMVVEALYHPNIGNGKELIGFKNYTKPDAWLETLTARESFDSLKEHLKIYLRNPHGGKEPKNRILLAPGESESRPIRLREAYNRRLVQWHTAQKSTFPQIAVVTKC